MVITMQMYTCAGIKRTTVEISIIILSCVILGLNPVMPFILYFTNSILLTTIWNLNGFCQIKYIHTSTGGPTCKACYIAKKKYGVLYHLDIKKLHSTLNPKA